MRATRASVGGTTGSGSPNSRAQYSSRSSSSVTSMRVAAAPRAAYRSSSVARSPSTAPSRCRDMQPGLLGRRAVVSARDRRDSPGRGQRVQAPLCRIPCTTARRHPGRPAARASEPRPGRSGGRARRSRSISTGKRIAIADVNACVAASSSCETPAIDTPCSEARLRYGEISWQVGQSVWKKKRRRGMAALNAVRRAPRVRRRPGHPRLPPAP